MNKSPWFTRHSYYLLSGFMVTICLILIIWWPLAKDYLALIDPDKPILLQIDWLLIGIFLCMSLLIIIGADIKKDIWVVAIGAVGGFIIESWGTHTGLWQYFTGEKPPLWIIPAWPIAALSITRLTNLIGNQIIRGGGQPLRIMTSILLYTFFAMAFWFIRWTLNNPFSILVLCFILLLIFSVKVDTRVLLFFLVGSFAGIFLEVWGTTRECWTYYTRETPPLFAIFAHGFAAMAFYQVELLLNKYYIIVRDLFLTMTRRIQIKNG
jgi:hypothetical protein